MVPLLNLGLVWEEISVTPVQIYDHNVSYVK